MKPGNVRSAAAAAIAAFILGSGMPESMAEVARARRGSLEPVDEATNRGTPRLTPWQIGKVKNALGKGSWARKSAGKLVIAFYYDPLKWVDADPRGRRFRMWGNGKGHTQIGEVGFAFRELGVVVVLVDEGLATFVKEELSKASEVRASRAAAQLPGVDGGGGRVRRARGNLRNLRRAVLHRGPRGQLPQPVRVRLPAVRPGAGSLPVVHGREDPDEGPEGKGQSDR